MAVDSEYYRVYTNLVCPNDSEIDVIVLLIINNEETTVTVHSYYCYH